jgi:hypothetical protein
MHRFAEPLNAKMPPISYFFGRWLLKNPFFLFAGTILFDEKILKSAAQPVFRTRLGDIKPPSKHKMYSSAFFGGLELFLYGIQRIRTLNTELKFKK